MDFHSDVLGIIFLNLSSCDKVIARCVCKKWQSLIPKQGKVDNEEFTKTLSIVQWAVSCGAKLDESMVSWLAHEGNLAGLQWARRKGAPWDIWTCAHAAEGGHLDVLKWAREHGASWDDYTLIFTSNLELFQWALKEGCPCSPDVKDQLLFFNQGHILDQGHILEWCEANNIFPSS